jgi:hypothetical protein
MQIHVDCCSPVVHVQVSGIPAGVSEEKLMALLCGPGGVVVDRLDLCSAPEAASDKEQSQVCRAGLWLVWSRWGYWLGCLQSLQPCRWLREVGRQGGSAGLLVLYIRRQAGLRGTVSLYALVVEPHCVGICNVAATFCRQPAHPVCCVTHPGGIRAPADAAQPLAPDRCEGA